MRAAIEAFLALGLPVRPPLSTAELAELSERLGAPLPAPIAELYGAFGGQDPSSQAPRYPMRLMPVDEVIAANELLQGQQCEWLSPATGVLYFWTDDNSNWAGVFVTGPLAGTVHVLDHDEPDEVPRYRSVARFVTEIERACRSNTCWFDMPTDYPSPAELASELHAHDVALVQTLRTALANEPAERHALAILQVAPASQAADLLEFLDAETLHVRSIACLAIGRRNLAAAIDKLATIARNDTPENPVIYALVALNQITDPRARAILRELRVTADPGLADYFPTE